MKISQVSSFIFHFKLNHLLGMANIAIGTLFGVLCIDGQYSETRLLRFDVSNYKLPSNMSKICEK